MKKLFAILAVVAFVFAACGPKENAEAENVDSTAAVVEEEVVVADTMAVDSTVAEVVAE